MELILNIIIIVLLVITNILIIVKNRKTNVFTKNDLKEVQKQLMNLYIIIMKESMIK